MNLIELLVVEELLDSSGSPSGVGTLQVLVNSLKFNREVLRKRADVVSCDLEDMLPSVSGRLIAGVGVKKDFGDSLQIKKVSPR